MSMQLETRSSPALWCPFPARVSPHASSVHQGTLRWLQQFGLGGTCSDQQASIAEVAFLAARFHPDAPRDVLQLIAQWYAWFFCQDDECDRSNLGCKPSELATFQARLLTILRQGTPQHEDDCLVHALYDLKRSSQRIASERWMDRLAANISEYFATMVWEAHNRQHGIMPSLDTYVRLRPITGGLPIEHVFAQLSYNIVLPQHVQRRGGVQRITTLADQAICWVNDLLSLPKEVQRGDLHNLVLVLQHEQQVPRACAVDQVVALHNTTVQHVAELAARVPADEADEHVAMLLQQYVDMLQTRIAGHVDWALTAHRYEASAA